MNRKIALALLITFIGTSIAYSQSSFQIPSENWSLEIDLEGFEVQQQGTSPDGTMLQVAAINKKENINLSIFIEKVDSDGDKLACRDYYWSKAEKSPLAKENLTKYETDELAIVEHDTKKFKGQTVNFHSLNAYLAYNGYWMDVHISKIDYAKKDKSLFEKVWKSISIKDNN